ncbi:MAG: DoxX family membrane protein [Chloroflexi bacterium]|nr:DoxX family membrane protein [Chloroflexota bacterium]
MKNFIQNRWVWLTLRLLVGGLFMFTSIPKIADINGFIEIVTGYGILPAALARLAGTALPFVELYLGISFLLGVFVRLSAAVTIPLSASFGFAGIYALVVGGGIVCGCFGTWLQISHQASMAIDGVMLVLSLALVTQREKNFLILGQMFDSIKPDFRAQRSKLYNASLFASVVLVVAVITGIIFALK